MILYEYKNLLPQVQVLLPGCPEALVLDTFKATGRSFCLETEAWIEQLALISLVASQAAYSLVPSFEAEIKRIESVRMGTTASPPTEDTTVTSPEGYDLTLSSTGIQNVLTFRTSHVPATAQTSGLMVKVVLVPRLDCVELPAWFMERWAEALVAGTLADLMAMPKKAWTNFALVGKYQATLQTHVSRARFETLRKYKNKSLVITPAQFF